LIEVLDGRVATVNLMATIVPGRFCLEESLFFYSRYLASPEETFWLIQSGRMAGPMHRPSGEGRVGSLPGAKHSWVSRCAPRVKLPTVNMLAYPSPR
jgi:hypothetical protein